MKRFAHILVTAALLSFHFHLIYAAASSQPTGAGDAAGMSTIPAGPFLYGEKGKEQELSLPAFLMDLYEVSNADYVKVRPREYPPEKAKHPVVGITWDEAKQHCEAVGKRLPSEQ
ncbi:MAG: formylglycine-generating enzyme family protein, partial [Nitrospiraceae bacterium]